MKPYEGSSTESRWESELPPGFPLQRIYKQALAEGRARRERRKKRQRRLVVGVFLLLAAVAMAASVNVRNRDEIDLVTRPGSTIPSQEAQDSPPLGRREVCAQDLTVRRQPSAGGVSGTLYRGETVEVDRYEAGPDGPYTYAHGLAKGRAVSGAGWVVSKFLGPCAPTP